ncbi:hypothetical protein GUITHDRAFT_100608 [Guillardia theta CCMP2712]|uniref:Uncharacterized protein n=1 Tax=Guillardia theta (strain CCMP2712) TaxID=905079 RepID=L1JZ76_GUITC|nr:hypothetical protein GUITHDRAFT_100608 [Guillardia theta CCMP2712]EKX53624.1 hypothetical protein GUITHDRAFT_100608 [Guillardia theta CCMP2712]|eukprot:XP_005840604.1 hypothetical protein GUITHDRAFT_100608 [Guillardia theta CCMP2712]
MAWIGPEEARACKTKLWPRPDRQRRGRSWPWLMSWLTLAIVLSTIENTRRSEENEAFGQQEKSLYRLARLSAYSEVRSPAQFWAWLDIRWFPTSTSLVRGSFLFDTSSNTSEPRSSNDEAPLTMRQHRGGSGDCSSDPILSHFKPLNTIRKKFCFQRASVPWEPSVLAQYVESSRKRFTIGECAVGCSAFGDDGCKKFLHTSTNGLLTGFFSSYGFSAISLSQVGQTSDSLVLHLQTCLGEAASRMLLSAGKEARRVLSVAPFNSCLTNIEVRRSLMAASLNLQRFLTKSGTARAGPGPSDLLLARAATSGKGPLRATVKVKRGYGGWELRGRAESGSREEVVVIVGGGSGLSSTLQGMRTNSWIDRDTRAFGLDSWILNPAARSVARLSFFLESTAGGVFLPQISLRVVSLYEGARQQTDVVTLIVIVVYLSWSLAYSVRYYPTSLVARATVFFLKMVLKSSSPSSSSFLDNLTQALCWRTTESVLNGLSSLLLFLGAFRFRKSSRSLVFLLRSFAKASAPIAVLLLLVIMFLLLSSIPAAISVSSWGDCVQLAFSSLLTSDVFYGEAEEEAKPHHRSYRLSSPLAEASNVFQLLLGLSIVSPLIAAVILYTIPLARKPDTRNMRDPLPEEAIIYHNIFKQDIFLLLRWIDHIRTQFREIFWRSKVIDMTMTMKMKEMMEMGMMMEMDPDYDPSEFEPFTAGDVYFCIHERMEQFHRHMIDKMSSTSQAMVRTKDATLQETGRSRKLRRFGLSACVEAIRKVSWKDVVSSQPKHKAVTGSVNVLLLLEFHLHGRVESFFWTGSLLQDEIRPDLCAECDIGVETELLLDKQLDWEAFLLGRVMVKVFLLEDEDALHDQSRRRELLTVVQPLQHVASMQQTPSQLVTVWDPHAITQSSLPRTSSGPIRPSVDLTLGATSAPSSPKER